jgi:hypothetical protein
MFVLLGICTSLALFLTGYLIAAPAVWMATPGVLRLFKTRDSGRLANCLFILRVVPAALAAALVIFVSGPSFLAFEPRESEEMVGWKLAFVAGIATAGVVW